MNKELELKLNLLKGRLHLLESRPTENGGVIRKVKRKIRMLER